MERILFASDFTVISAKAEEYTRNIARAVTAKVTILHAIEPIADSENDQAVEKFLDNKKDKAAAQAEEVAGRFRDAGIECDIKVEIGKRWKTVVDSAVEGKYDLVVLGSHKIHDGDKVYLGTTTHKVFFGADVPLLVVPAS